MDKNNDVVEQDNVLKVQFYAQLKKVQRKDKTLKGFQSASVRKTLKKYQQQLTNIQVSSIKIIS